MHLTNKHSKCFLAIHEITEAIVTVIGSGCERRMCRRASPTKILFTLPPPPLQIVLSDGGLRVRDQSAVIIMHSAEWKTDKQVERIGTHRRERSPQC